MTASDGGEPPAGFDPSTLLGLDEIEASTALQGLAVAGCKSAELEYKVYSDCCYINSKELGLSLRLKPASSGQVDVAFLYKEGVDGFREYRSGPLPQGLKWSDTNREVVKRLGEPSDKFGGGRLAVGISYETLGLDVTFKSSSWEDSQNPITFLGVFAGKDQAFNLCTRCCKLARFHCGKCYARRYCSSACQKADWTRHKEECTGLTVAAAAAVAQLALPEPAKPTVLLETMD